MFITKRQIFFAILIILLAYLFQSKFLAADDNGFNPNYCVLYCFIMKGGTHESCSIDCNVPLNLSPRGQVRTFKPSLNSSKATENDPDCPKGYSPKI
jgi:hypothetical protein